MLNLIEKFTPAVEADTSDAGLTTVEYAVGAAVVAVGTVTAFALLGTNVMAEINRLAAAI